MLYAHCTVYLYQRIYKYIEPKHFVSVSLKKDSRWVQRNSLLPTLGRTFGPVRRKKLVAEKKLNKNKIIQILRLILKSFFTRAMKGTYFSIYWPNFLAGLAGKLRQGLATLPYTIVHTFADRWAQHHIFYFNGYYRLIDLSIVVYKLCSL